METYIVYKHTCPNEKVYIGITKHSDPNKRWQNGKGYAENRHFTSAINKYGWNTIQHEILASNISLENACALEQFYIRLYDSTNSSKGYNIMPGGQFNTKFPDDVIETIRAKAIARWKDPTFRANEITKLKGHPVSEETRAKLHFANLGKPGNGGWNKGIKLSESEKAKLRGRPSWSKGLTKYTDARLMKTSESMKGRIHTQSQISKQKETLRNKYSSGYSVIWINDGTSESTVEKGTQIPEGWKLGRLNRNYKYIYKDSQSKKVPYAELDSYLAQGWSIGRHPNAVKHIQLSNSKYIYRYKNNSFTTSYELCSYLNSHGYPDIVASTISSIVCKGVSYRYPELADLIKRECVHETS